MNIHCHSAAANELGESALWDKRHNRLVWIDITNRKVFWMNSDNDRTHHIKLPDTPGCIVLAQGGGYLMAAGQTLYHLDDDFGNLKTYRRIEKLNARTRLNDGKVDRAGGFVFGSCDLNEIEPLGSTFYLGTAGVIPLADGFTVFNGPAFSPSGDRIYYTDSPTRKIITANYQSDSGRIIPPYEVFATVPSEAGYPDGMTVDSHGHLWSAHWDGSQITRYRPDGNIDQQIQVPVTRPTSLCFGGPELTTLFITSAFVDPDLKKNQIDGIMDGDVIRLETITCGIAEAAVVIG